VIVAPLLNGAVQLTTMFEASTNVETKVSLSGTKPQKIMTGTVGTLYPKMFLASIVN
jgi:hypothetical protein